MAQLLIRATAYGKREGITLYFSVCTADGILVEGIAGNDVKAKLLYAGSWSDIATTLKVKAHYDSRHKKNVSAKTINLVKAEGLTGFYSLSAHPTFKLDDAPPHYEERQPYVIQIQVASNLGQGQTITGGTIEAKS